VLTPQPSLEEKAGMKMSDWHFRWLWPGYIHSRSHSLLLTLSS